jgi:hypothetical protein
MLLAISLGWRKKGLIKSVDLFVGVKAEQTLRDAARAAAEEQAETAGATELCPVGKKDWIAGYRIDGPIRFGDLEERTQRAQKRLIELASHQRIRNENLKVWAVRKPVPVFKDPLPKDLDQIVNGETPGPDKGMATCPVCGSQVNIYNIQYNPRGKMVGCYLCRGEPPNEKG